MRLEDAIDRLDAIHVQVLRSETFRGVRAVPTAATGVIALAAAVVQAAVVPPSEPADFVEFWIAVAAIAATIGALEIVRSAVRGGPSALRRAAVVMRQVLPALGVGAIVTVVLLQTGDRATTLLPGLWALCFATALAAAQPFLPASIALATGFYFLAGVILLVPDCREPLPEPLGMGLTFGIGQLLVAVALRRSAREIADGS